MHGIFIHGTFYIVMCNLHEGLSVYFAGPVDVDFLKNQSAVLPLFNLHLNKNIAIIMVY